MSSGQRTPKVPPVITSTASAPPTPMPSMASPPAVGTEVGVRMSAVRLLVLGIVEVVERDLLGQRARPSQSLAPERGPLGQVAVHVLDQLQRRARGDGHAFSLRLAAAPPSPAR